MKKLFTLVLFFSCGLLFSQNSTLTVDVKKACGDDFTKAIEIKLFEIIAGQKIQIAEQSTQPAIFDKLYNDRPYIVEVSSAAISDYKISVEDLLHLHQYILGITPLKSPGIYAAEASSNSALSAIDLVMLSRDKLALDTLENRNWFFVAEENLNVTSQFPSDVINRLYIEKLNSSNKNVKFLAYEKYAITSTVKEECDDCGKTANQEFSITAFNDNLHQGIEKSIGISIFNPYFRVNGFSFLLKLKNAKLAQINVENNALINISDDSTTVQLLSTNLFYSSPYGNIGSIRIIPEKDGKVDEFFEIDKSFMSEIVYQDDCFLTSNILNFNSTLPCPIEWPPYNITVPDCINKYETGTPSFPQGCSSFMMSGFEDTPIDLPDGTCIKTIRRWTVLNWLSGEVHEYTQIIRYQSDYEPVCINADVVVLDAGTTIYAKDLIEKPIENHIYSFSENDETDTTKVLDSELPLELNCTIYDITDSTFCLAKIHKYINCEPTLNIKTELSVNSTSGYYRLKAKDFDGGNSNYCHGTVKSFNISLEIDNGFEEELNLDYNNYKGQDLELHLRYILNNKWVYYGIVTVHLIDNVVIHPPFEFQCYNDPLTNNVPFEIAFFSPTFENIYGIQGAIKVTDGTIIKTTNKSLDQIIYNNAGNIARFLWFEASPKTLNFDDTIFTLTILPSKSAPLSDFISIDDNALIGEAYLDDLNSTKIDLNFSFLNRTTSTKDINNFITINPNPLSSDILNIFLPHYYNKSQYSLINSQGALVVSGKIELNSGKGSITIPAFVSNGMYIIQVRNNNNYITSKVILNR